MSGAVSTRRMTVCAVITVLFAVFIYLTVDWGSRPPPPEEKNVKLLRDIESGTK